jgi:EmrB/QacA subfamily drug resistance transporter
MSSPKTAEASLAAPPERPRPAPRTVLAVASLGVAFAFVDATIVNIAFPSIAASFRGTPISSLSWVLNAYNVVFAALIVAAGSLADRLGRKRMFVLGLELFTAASLLCAISPSVEALVAFRAVQAIGGALIVPAALALVLQAFPADRRSHGVALLWAIGSVAAGLGPALGGLLVAAAGWRLVFLVNLPVCVGAIVLARRLLSESRAPGSGRLPDLFGALLFALAISALLLAIVKGQAWGWASPRTFGSFGAAAVLLSVFGWRCGRHRAPVIDPGLLRIPNFGVTNALTVITAAGFFGYTLANVLFLTGVWHYSELQAGLALTPGPLVTAVVAGPASRLVLRVGYRPVLVTGGLAWGAAVLWFVLRVGTSPAFVTQWLPGTALLGIGSGMLFPNLTSAAVASVPGGAFATATGINSVARQVGAALGVAVSVAIIGKPTALLAAARAFHEAWTFGSACLFAAGLGCLLIVRRGREAGPARDGWRAFKVFTPRTRGVLSITHRGGLGADCGGSLDAFARTIELGARFLELDLRTTTTGAVVVWHGAGLQRFRRSQPLDVGRLAAGHPAPVTFEQVVTSLPDDVRYLLDIKDDPTTAALPALVARLGCADRICVASFSHRRVMATASSIAWLTGTEPCRAMSMVEVIAMLFRSVLPRRKWTARAATAQVPAWAARPRTIRTAHDGGALIVAWTVNTEREMHRLLDRGADGIVTDQPAALDRVLLARELPPANQARMGGAHGRPGQPSAPVT